MSDDVSVPQDGEDEKKKRRGDSAFDGSDAIDAADLATDAVRALASRPRSSVPAVSNPVVVSDASAGVAHAAASAADASTVVADAAGSVADAAGGVVDVITGIFDGL
jgi:hypothetical protein